MTKFLAILLLLPIFICSGCTRLFFFPDSIEYLDPKEIGLTAEDIFLETSEGSKIHGIFLTSRSSDNVEIHNPAIKLFKKNLPQNPPRPIIYYLHGNAQNITAHLQNTIWLEKKGFDIFALDYRGYGKSEGTASVEAALKDIEIGLKFLKQKFPDRKVIIYAQSLGASLTLTFLGKTNMAINTPTNHSKINLLKNVELAIIESPFTSYQQIAHEVIKSSTILYPFLVGFILGVSNEFSPSRYIQEIQSPELLFIHSTNDQIIPFDSSIKLFLAASIKNPRHHLWLVNDAPHIQIFQSLQNQVILEKYLITHGF